ncbi:DUF3782 domain-containing protein [Thiospirillum jenense]|uniref:DUF3782 domain-containing protein n=1 Tax=Thiospirillum jenense TaxID=1653858 RepID=A0A839HP04_9GAMM|nr:DUF3782 domain-containing protein [Thiospirillum jenense]MBB1127012.1 DUF3782 domain-containing protein [Thiospirillum jenense]
MTTTYEDILNLFRENDVQIKQLLRAQQETERRFQDTEREQKETARQLKELGKQIGRLGEKFGSFTEGLALPSMARILRQQFQMEIISPSVRASKAGQHLEIDVLAYANGEVNTAYIVEVKSHLREEAITQLKNILDRFRAFFPEHRDKRLFGILAAVDLLPTLRERILNEGLYVARIHDGIFELDTPADFQPKAW